MKSAEASQRDDPGDAADADRREPPGASPTVNLPVVCTLTADTMATRKADLLPGLVRRAESREDTADGVRLRFPPDTLSALLTTVDAERQCCRFLRFEIAVEADGGPIWLSLSGPPGTREFLGALFQP